MATPPDRLPWGVATRGQLWPCVATGGVHAGGRSNEAGARAHDGQGPENVPGAVAKEDGRPWPGGAQRFTKPQVQAAVGLQVHGGDGVIEIAPSTARLGWR